MTGAILIVDRNLLRHRGQRYGEAAGRAEKIANRQILADGPAVRPYLYHALTQQFVLSGEQILNQIVTALIGIARSPGEMMIDPRSG